MADRYLWNVQSTNKALVVLPLELTVLGNTTPANGTFLVTKGKESTQPNAAGAAVFARTGVGEYRVTLKDKFPFHASGSIDCYAHGGAARQARIKTINATSGYVDFQIMTEALVPGETPNGETDTIRLVLFMKNTNVDR